MAAVHGQGQVVLQIRGAGWPLCLLVILLMALSGCVAPGQPVVTDRSTAKSQQGSYVVRKGDTLYSIAWRFNLDHQRLAAANQIGAPFTIYPGQRLRLSESAPVRRSRPSKPVAGAANAGAQNKTKPQNRAPSRSSASTGTQPRVATGSATKTSAPKRATTPAPAGESFGTDRTWYKPLPQKPAVLFGKNNKGLDYAIQSRADVLAARSGKVVYAGNGIAGFERLIIIQHSRELLSAYSFNGKLLVQEQQQVGGGKAIATILPRPGVGQTLHFELRRQGKPIDPKTVLP